MTISAAAASASPLLFRIHMSLSSMPEASGAFLIALYSCSASSTSPASPSNTLTMSSTILSAIPAAAIPRRGGFEPHAAADDAGNAEGDAQRRDKQPQQAQKAKGKPQRRLVFRIVDGGRDGRGGGYAPG